MSISIHPRFHSDALMNLILPPGWRCLWWKELSWALVLLFVCLSRRTTSSSLRDARRQQPQHQESDIFIINGDKHQNLHSDEPAAIIADVGGRGGINAVQKSGQSWHAPAKGLGEGESLEPEKQSSPQENAPLSLHHESVENIHRSPRLQEWLDRVDSTYSADEVDVETSKALALRYLEERSDLNDYERAFHDLAAAYNLTNAHKFPEKALRLTQSMGGETRYPMCEVFKVVGPLRLHCPVVALSLLFVTSTPPSLRLFSTEHDDYFPSFPWRDGDRTAVPPPHVLEDIGIVPDYIEDKALLDRERPVYRWCWRQIVNFYGYTHRWHDLGLERAQKVEEARRDGFPPPPPSRPLPLLPAHPGYGNQRLLWLPEEENPVQRPIGQAFIYYPPSEGKAEGAGGEAELVVVLRGTVFSEEWSSNFRLHEASQDVLRAYGMEGAIIPKGFFAMFQALVPQINAALAAHGRAFKALTFTGHSLGGSLSLLLGTYYARQHPDLRLSIVTFGAPNVADAVFFERHYDTRINLRQLTYIGSGLLPPDERGASSPPSPHPAYSFGLGDIFAQMPPDCTAVSPCPLFLFPAGDSTLQELKGDMFKRIQLARAPGSVVIHARDLAGRASVDSWLAYEDFAVQADTRLDAGLIATHVCAYACWVSTGGEGAAGEETRCYFPEEGEGRAEGEICDLLLSRSEMFGDWAEEGGW